MAKRVIRWLGCSHVPLTQLELEQAMLLGNEEADDAPRVDSSTDLVNLCGPIAELIGETPKLAHFTAHE
jgi:hypothetical protein